MSYKRALNQWKLVKTVSVSRVIGFLVSLARRTFTRRIETYRYIIITGRDKSSRDVFRSNIKFAYVFLFVRFFFFFSEKYLTDSGLFFRTGSPFRDGREFRLIRRFFFLSLRTTIDNECGDKNTVRDYIFSSRVQLLFGKIVLQKR